ncbi:hypothetical protein [Pseudoalteromonas rubra]|uniref:hypothetical protein n=1 Tax=Pseudoalteromonas rubra TaxID=43658 RepID=UPI002DBF7EEF|nr:hypothetical protein [Pseudoalteromonas rubra]MEC4089756.1 hypothetical protein [Pseudoalteromonas rubra]
MTMYDHYTLPEHHQHLLHTAMAQRIDQASPATIGELIAQMQSLNWSVFISGGAPRDWVEGLQAQDIDLSVNTSFADLYAFCLSIFQPHQLLTDPDFGLVTVLGSEYKLDINILREAAFSMPVPPRVGLSQSHQHDEVKQSATTALARLQADILSRDFAVNALYYCCDSGHILDPSQQGLSDLKHRRLSFVMCTQRLAHDNVVCIRILQFIARGFEPNEEVKTLLCARLETAVMQQQEFQAWLAVYIGTDKAYYPQFKACAYHYAASQTVKNRLQHYFSNMESES